MIYIWINLLENLMGHTHSYQTRPVDWPGQRARSQVTRVDPGQPELPGKIKKYIWIFNISCEKINNPCEYRLYML